jgi:hypothetical protein
MNNFNINNRLERKVNQISEMFRMLINLLPEFLLSCQKHKKMPYLSTVLRYLQYE